MSEINIECPDCKKRFLVSPELMGKTAECSHCDAAFVVSQANVKPHPQRHKPLRGNKEFKSFTRSTPDLVKNEAPSARSTAYHRQVDVSAVMPLGPIRVLSILAGVTIAGLVALTFILGSSELGMFNDVGGTQRWVLAGFTALISTLLLVYGFRKYKAVGYPLIFVTVIGLFSLPLIYPERAPDKAVDSQPKMSQLEDKISARQALDLYKRELGYATVQHKIDSSAEPESLVAIALKGVKPVHLDLIKAYLSQSLNSDQRPNEYKGRRIAGVDTTLLIYQRVTMPVEEFAQLMEKFSLDTKIRPELQLIEVAVDVNSLAVSDRAEMLDESKEGFYAANLAELKSIDQSRQLLAIQRLGKSQALRLRADIEQQLLELLQKPNYPHRAEVIQALVNWDTDSKLASAIIASQAIELIADNKEVPLSTLNYCVKHDFENSNAILIYAWKRERVVHEQTLIAVGSRAEDALLPELENLEPILLESAGNVLRNVGTEKSLPALLTLHESSTGAVKKSLKAAIDEISSRR